MVCGPVALDAKNVTPWLLLVFHTNVDEESRRVHLWFDIDTVVVELN